jgi:hypothetical protein
VFQQEKNIPNLTVLAQLDQPLLEAQGRGVINGAEVENRDQILGRRFARIITD